MTILQTLLLSLIEGITEFLPVSSTGHLILAEHLLKIPSTEFVKTFTIVIQLGAILAVVGMYAKSHLFKKEVFWRLVAGFIPTGLIGLAFYKVVKTYLLGSSTVVLWSLLLGGIALIAVEWWFAKHDQQEKSLEELSYAQAALIGVWQALAIVPGVSRSAATIIGGRFLKLGRVQAVEFSFLLAVPTMLAATGLDVIKTGWSFSASEWWLLVLGVVGAYISAYVAIKYFLRFVQTHTLSPFGVYRIVLALVLFLII